MTKSERLLFLMSFLRQRGAASIAELSEHCHVSRRTIYRDLNSLTRMNIPIVYDKGYRLADRRDVPAMQIGVDEIDLLKYACTHNPASGYRFFRQQFALIQQKLSEYLQPVPGSLGRFIRIETPTGQAAKSASKDMDFLQAFCNAIEARRKVYLEFSDSRASTGYYIPRSICLTESGVSVLVQGSRAGDLHEFDCARIRAIHVTSEVFSLSDHRH